MLAPAPARVHSRALEFGIYRDGDNNLDQSQETVVAQARRISAGDARIEFTVEDTTRTGQHSGRLRTDGFTIADGVDSPHETDRAHDMSARKNLAAFVAQTLDDAQRSNASQTWIELVDHGGGDGGGLEADHAAKAMRADDIAGAIADGAALHAKAHPEDAARKVDGVVANACLMATLGFSSALSHADVKYLAASPETMLSPGVPTAVASDIAAHLDDPAAMASAVVKRTMDTRFPDFFGHFAPAAAFDVIDLDPQKTAAVQRDVTDLNAAVARAAHDGTQRAALREDAAAVDGMVRDDKTGLPWHADRPAIELYRTFAGDGRLDATVREAAKRAATDIGATVLAHGESSDFEPFGNADYGDAVGPTVHFPVTRKQVDPWAPQLSETDNAFYRAVGSQAVTNALVGSGVHASLA